ncbi:MAG TPA: hypothetical protein DDW27_14870 [Bacteroidales bacterium]|nr:hypothetical protein [Bacteroidales bacterium]
MKKIVVVGFGFMGLTHTINILHSKNLELTAIIDRDIDFIENSLMSKAGNISIGNLNSERLRNVRKYSDLDACMKSEDFDAVVICVPTSFHFEMTRKVLSYGKHVFLEKPICLDISQAEYLIDLAQKKSRIFMVGHVVRFMPPYQKLKKWAETFEFGNLKFLSLHRFSGRPGWGQWTEKSVADSSGGALFDLVIHDIDFANYLFGIPDCIESTCLPGSLSRHDYISAMWKYGRKDVHVSIEGGNRFHINLPFQAGYMAQFEKASMLYTTLKGNVICIADDKSIREVPSGDATTGYFNELIYFTDCMEYNSQPAECMPVSSLEAIKLCYKHINK